MPNGSKMACSNIFNEPISMVMGKCKCFYFEDKLKTCHSAEPEWLKIVVLSG
jgi:hypothetical protein